MRRREFLMSSSLAFAAAALEPLAPRAAAEQSSTRKILIAGGNFGTAFHRYMASLTGKPRPRICYLPTASADSPTGIISWYRSVAPLNVEPFVQESFIASTRQT